MVMNYACAALLHASDPIWLLCHCRFSCKWRLHPLNFWDVHVEPIFLLSFFALTVVVHFAGGGGCIIETFKSVDSDFIVP